MTIEIDDKSYIVGMWFSSDPVTNNDWLACVIRDPDMPTRYKGWSRFRYVKDAKIWGSEIKKAGQPLPIQEGATDEDMIHYMDLAQNLESAYKEKDRIIVKGDIRQLFEIARNKPWMNMKEVKV